MIFEKSCTDYRAHVPDFPACDVAGYTLAQTQNLMREALLLHRQAMRKDGQRVPRPRSLAELRRKGLVSGHPR
jgi:predicted RNase H-like HicB family nuclease